MKQSINVGFARMEIRKFPRNIEFAFFNHRGRFRLAIYIHLPLYWITAKALHSSIR
jgi:hypothetical protein